VAVIRISGAQARDVAQTLCGRVPAPRTAQLTALRDPYGAIIDKALVLFFPSPHSFTGEDVIEFQVHGGRSVVAGVIEACLTVSGVALARPGDFTRRAFENGKFDLSAAEGLADLIEAETVAQRRQALRQMEGGLAREVQSWRETIIDALADAEGDIDFPDEDLPPGLSARARDRIRRLRDELDAHMRDAGRALRIRDGFRAAIIGAPNAGKSSLLNALARREAAIVSPIAGTTRDIVEVRLMLSGQILLLADTAGLRDTQDEIEEQGVARALEAARSADIRLGIISSPAEKTALLPYMQPQDLWILSKADIEVWQPESQQEIVVSSKTGLGLDVLEGQLARLAALDSVNSEGAPLTRLRHKEAVAATIAALDRALLAQGSAAELIAEDLRLAARALAQIVGRVDMDDVLDRLFSQFCIGK
jgi:tRNA modification GTPase